MSSRSTRVRTRRTVLPAALDCTAPHWRYPTQLTRRNTCLGGEPRIRPVPHGPRASVVSSIPLSCANSWPGGSEPLRGEYPAATVARAADPPAVFLSSLRGRPLGALVPRGEEGLSVVGCGRGAGVASSGAPWSRTRSLGSRDRSGRLRGNRRAAVREGAVRAGLRRLPFANWTAVSAPPGGRFTRSSRGTRGDARVCARDGGAPSP